MGGGGNFLFSFMYSIWFVSFYAGSPLVWTVRWTFGLCRLLIRRSCFTEYSTGQDPCTPPVSAEEVSTQTTCTSSIDSHVVARYSFRHDVDMRQFY